MHLIHFVCLRPERKLCGHIERALRVDLILCIASIGIYGVHVNKHGRTNIIRLNKQNVSFIDIGDADGLGDRWAYFLLNLGFILIDLWKT